MTQLSCIENPFRDRLVVIPDEYAIRYCKNANFEQIWQPIAERVPYILTGFLGLIFVMAYFNILESVILLLGHLLLSPLKPFLQASPNPAIAGVIDLISQFSLWVYAAAGIYTVHLAISRADKPTHIGLTKSGIVLTSYKEKNSLHWIVQSIPWEEISSVSVERPKSTKSTNDYQIKITSGRLKQTTSIRYGDMLVPSERETFLTALKIGVSEQAYENNSPEDVFAVFRAAKSTEGFTELWLNELVAPSKREKLTPLAANMTLQSGEYTITRKLGTGGQGIVYLATRTNKVQNSVETVALKEFVMPVFPDARVRKSVAEKFQAEAEMLSRLSHPQIVKLHDVFVEDHRAYLVLERITGKTLKRLVEDGGALSEVDVISYANQMCDILKYLHGQEPPVVHRDFTPDNLMLSDDGKIYLIDFSVAQQIEINITGSVVGKHLYMAPEQFRGKATVASDVYSFGATLYFLLTGSEPEAIAVSHPKRALDSVSEQMESIVAGCTAIEESSRLTLEQVRDKLPTWSHAHSEPVVSDNSI